MKPILLFNDKLDLHKERLIETIVTGLQIHFVNCAITKDTDIKDGVIYVKNVYRNLAAIFISDTKKYNTVSKLAFKETINVQSSVNLFETIHTPQLIFICNFQKNEIPNNETCKYHIISVD